MINPGETPIRSGRISKIGDASVRRRFYEAAHVFSPGRF